ncbi:SEC-C domain-containing protein [Mycolicibacterium sp. jd]|uniref:SEC-C domain-containing protein n=1 Tax=unclassified Mycolicibacterium TaxID=2636767 RepID=UPI00351B43F1
MDPLAPLGRNEECWCGSGVKYKRCHGNHRPGSQPGAPLPPDLEGSVFLSPTVNMAGDAITVPEGGAPFRIVETELAARAVEYTNWDSHLIEVAASAGQVLSPPDLGRLRVEVLSRLASLSTDDSVPSDEVKHGILLLAAQSIRTVSALAQKTPKPSMLWNQELDPAKFLGRTLLLADHVVMPDRVFKALLGGPQNKSLRRAAETELKLSKLLSAGLVIPVPIGPAMALSGAASIKLTNHDLEDAALVSWVRDQLILEGPTAREALFVRAKDDLSMHADKFWLYSHIDPDSLSAGDGRFTSRMLQPYDPAHDYNPWIRQVSDSAISFYVQRTAKRLVTADVYGSDYVSASMFEARLLNRRGRSAGNSAAQAAMWADVPQLPSLSAPDLVKVIQNEEAVEDLRRLVRASLVTARTPGEQAGALTALAHQLDATSHRLETSSISDRWWQMAAPGGLGAGGGLVIGSFSGGLPAALGATLGVLAGIAPYLGARANARREAAHLFLTARRKSR